MKVYKEWLQSNGIRFQEEVFGIVFKYQGANFIISDNSSDPLYFQLIMPGIYDVQPGEKNKVLEVLNGLTRDIKCLKGVIQDGGSVWLMTEIFIDTTPEIDDFMDRLINILHSGRMQFYSKMQ
ncbi:MAG: hypothetical protein SPL28_04190 [Bacteroidales bacterium]|nr:hypothetical protein [Bacteroidales bacterium]